VERESAGFEQVHGVTVMESEILKKRCCYSLQTPGASGVEHYKVYSKEDAKKITFDSGRNKSQIDYIL